MDSCKEESEKSLLSEGYLQGQSNIIPEFLDEVTRDDRMEDLQCSDSLSTVETTPCGSSTSSDTVSWGSETPLLPDQKIESKEILHMEEDTSMTKLYDNSLNTKDNESMETLEAIVFVDVDPSLSHLTPLQDYVFGSDVSVAYSHTRDVEKVKANPLHVFGSGWEFGSVCSINLHGSLDVSMDQHNAIAPASPWQNRLLSRIFKDKISKLDLDKSMGKNSAKFISTESGDLSTYATAPSKQKNLKNLLILSTSIAFLHVAVYGLRNLQSSINSENGLGVFSLASFSGAFMFGSLVSPFVVQRYRPKLCLNVSCFGHFIYVVANYFPIFYVIIPASVIQGLSSALLWNALCTYITEIGLDEAFVKGKDSSSVLSRYFGIFFLTLQFSMVLGNLISSLILSQSENRIKPDLNQDIVPGAKFVSFGTVINDTAAERVGLAKNMSVPQMRCGAAHCDITASNETKPEVDDLDRLFLLGTYSSCAILSILVIQCFLDQLSNYTPRSSSLKATLKQAGGVLTMMADRKFCFVVMLCLYTVLSNGFVVADVLKAFITCPIGVRMVGYSMICFGICGSLSSYLFGKLAKCIGHVGAFLTG